MMIIFFTILELILIGLRIAAAYLNESALFAAAATPLTYACIVVGVVWLLFVIAGLCREFKGK